MKKLILAITASLCIATLISSCNNLGISAPKMDSDEATQLIVETLEKNINFDEWKIYEIRWMEADELENNLTVLFVEMVNKAGDCFSQTFTLSGPGKGNISDQDEAGGLSGKLDFEKVKGLTPASINVEAIRKQYEEAKAMIPENYTFKSIGDYLIQETVPSGNEFLDRNKTFGEVKAEFSMNITENGKEIVESAGKKSVQYYEVTFNVLPDGSVQMEELGDLRRHTAKDGSFGFRLSLFLRHTRTEASHLRKLPNRSPVREADFRKRYTALHSAYSTRQSANKFGAAPGFHYLCRR